LNVKGKKNVVDKCLDCIASLFTNRAIIYREEKGFDQMKVALSIGIQKMVRSDIGSSGVMFTIDTESGFDQVVFITSSYGLGECVVQGMVNPDEFYVYKPALKNAKHPIIRKNLGNKQVKMEFTQNKSANKSVQTINVPANLSKQFSITDEQIIELAKFAITIEEHYKKPMDIEWGLDGIDNQLYILQARPETIKSQENKNSKQTNNVSSKITKDIQIPFNWRHGYKIRGAVVHSGQVGGGHYFYIGRNIN
jgi:pyruvate,water dikinase